MTRDRTRAYALLAGGVAVVGLGAMAYFALAPRSVADPYADCRRSQVAGGAATIGGPFTLVNGAGAPETDKEAITGPTLVYFGYTFCPDICPTDLSRNALAADEVVGKGLRVGQVFISIDPERDTPEVVRDYVSSIHPDLVGLTGSPEQVSEAAREYKVYYRRAGDDPSNYLMDHSTFTYLVAPGGEFLEFYPSDASPEAVAESVACFAAKS